MIDILGIDGVFDLIRRLELRQGTFDDLNGAEINTGKVRMFSQGPYLHQGNENMSERESAQFERDNKPAFDYLRHLEEQVRDILKE